MNSIEFGGINSGYQFGPNYGTISISQVPQEREETRARPFSTVPYPHDPDFVCRDDIFERIHERASKPGCRIALFGLGGVGKTRLAMEYCHEARQKSPDTCIFWVHARTSARCQKSIHDIADRAKIPDRDNPKINIFQLFGNWLQDAGLGRWILVLDGLDSDELLKPPRAQNDESTPSPLQYLLADSRGTVIVTSRNKSVSLDITNPRNVLELKPMDRTDALSLFENKLGTRSDTEDTMLLLESLGYLPLAIVQAAAYITHRLPRFSVLQYLEVIQQSDHRAMQLLGHGEYVLDRDGEAESSILPTLQISLDHISVMNSSAADLLSLMSFFDPQAIPESTLRSQPAQSVQPAQAPSRRRGKYLSEFPQKLRVRFSRKNKNRNPGLSEFVTQEQFEDNIKTLHEYSLISMSENNGAFSMHRLVRLAARKWLQAHGQEEKWQERFLSHLWLDFPDDFIDPASWDKWRSLLPHAKAASSLSPKPGEGLFDWGRILSISADYANYMGNDSDALEFGSIGYAHLTKTIGADEKLTLDLTSDLIQTYRSMNRLDEALELGLHVLEVRRNKLGDNCHPTQIAMNNVGMTLAGLGRYQEAEGLMTKVQEYFTREGGQGDTMGLALTSLLGQMFYEQGRLREAEMNFLKVLALLEDGDSDSRRLPMVVAMEGLALVRKEQGQDAEALTSMRDCVAQLLRLSGPTGKDFIRCSDIVSQWENGVMIERPRTFASGHGTQ